MVLETGEGQEEDGKFDNIDNDVKSNHGNEAFLVLFVVFY